MGLKALYNYDLPAVCDFPVTGELIGTRFPPAIQNDPAGGNLIVGGQILSKISSVGNAEFVNDVPPTLLFP